MMVTLRTKLLVEQSKLCFDADWCWLVLLMMIDAASACLTIVSRGNFKSCWRSQQMCWGAIDVKLKLKYNHAGHAGSGRCWQEATISGEDSTKMLKLSLSCESTTSSWICQKRRSQKCCFKTSGSHMDLFAESWWTHQLLSWGGRGGECWGGGESERENFRKHSCCRDRLWADATPVVFQIKGEKRIDQVFGFYPCEIWF